jgi:hypothetical protein
MGYRSDVAIAVAFAEKQHLEEVMSVYALNMYVQKHDLLSSWEIGEYDDAWVAMYTAEEVKWYDTYEDVTGFNALGKLAKKFWEERSIPYAYRFVRIGEEDADVEIDVHESDCNGSDDNRGDRLADLLADALYVSRSVNNDITLIAHNDNN